MRGGSEAFFQVAVALIPAFLFGGAMRKPDEGWMSDGRMRLVILPVVTVSVVAEVFAIRGVIDPAVNRFEQYWVVFTVVGGTVLIAAMTARTWLQQPTRGKAVAVSLLAAALVGGFVVAAGGITQSLDNVETRDDLIRIDREVRRSSAALARADDADATARAALIATLLQLRSRTRETFSVPVERGIHAIDRIVQPVLQETSPRAKVVRTAARRLETPARQLSRPFYSRLGSERADPEVHLATLAVDRLIRAERLRMAAKVASAGALAEQSEGCRRAKEPDAAPGCGL